LLIALTILATVHIGRSASVLGVSFYIPTFKQEMYVYLGPIWEPGIATDNGLDGLRCLGQNPGKDKNILFSTSSTPAVGPIQTSCSVVNGDAFFGGKADRA
jgi:hypothetical protein